MTNLLMLLPPFNSLCGFGQAISTAYAIAPSSLEMGTIMVPISSSFGKNWMGKIHKCTVPAT